MYLLCLSDMISFVIAVLVSTLLIAISTFCIYLHLQHLKYDPIPGPKRESFFMGNLMYLLEEFKKDETGFTIGLKYLKLYGEIFVVWLGIKPMVIITHPQSIKSTIASNKHPKISGNSLNAVFGARFCGHNSIISNPGNSTWQRNRRLYTSYFNRASLKHYHDTIISVSKRLIYTLSDLCNSDMIVDMNYWINLAACDIIGLTAFNWDIDSLCNRDGKFADYLYQVSRMFYSLLFVSDNITR